MNKAGLLAALRTFRATLGSELIVLRNRRRKAAKAYFSRREKWSLVLLALAVVLALAMGMYVFAIYRGDIWDV